MSRIVKNYDLKFHNIITFGGIQLGGFGEDSAVEYEYPSDQFEDVVGADGEVTVSSLNDNRVYATITLMETSASFRELDALRKSQMAAARRGPILPLPWLHVDRVRGDTIADAFGVFMDRATPSKGRTAGERQFRILLPFAAEDMVQGALNFI